MARVTVEDCLARIPNRFALTILGSRRARALSEGRGTALVECDNKEGVTALREISGDRVRFKEDVEATMTEFIEEQRRQLRVTAGEHTFLEAASLRALEDDDDDGDDVEEGDVEELHSDPEALNKQAKGEGADEEVEADEETEEEEETEDEEPDPTDEETGDANFVDDDLAEDGEADEDDEEGAAGDEEPAAAEEEE